MIKLNQLISQIKPSATQAASTRAAQLVKEGKDVISLALGEPDFDTPPHVVDAAKVALDSGYTRYTKVVGIDKLRETIASQLNSENGTSFSAENILVSNGAKQSIAAACSVLLEPGDEVIIPAPYWTSYPEIVRIAGGKPVMPVTTAEDGYLLSAEKLDAAITDRTKIVLLCSPSNPTGACYSESEFRELADCVQKRSVSQDILFMSDEVYSYFVYGENKHVSLLSACPQLTDLSLLIGAFSKSYAMTGWRVGFTAGPAHIIKAMAVHQSQFTSNVCSISQHAAAAAFEDGGEFPRKMVAEFEKRKDIVCEILDGIDGVDFSLKPTGAFYAFFRIEELFGKRTGDEVINSSLDFVNHALVNHGVALVPGEAFGDPGAVRLSFAQSTEQIREGLKRIASAVAALN